MKTVPNRILIVLAIAIVIGTVGLLVRQFHSLDWIVENEDRIRSWVQQNRWQSWVVGLALFAVLSLVPGTVGKSVVAGWLFGFWQSVLMVEIGMTLGAMGGFSAARYLVRDIVVGRYGWFSKGLDQRILTDGAFMLVMIRVAQVPYTFVNYCAGITSVPLRTFAWTSALGFLPGTLVFVFVGTRIPTIGMIRENGVWALLDPWLFGVLAATIVLPLLIRSVVKRYRRSAATEGIPVPPAEG